MAKRKMILKIGEPILWFDQRYYPFYNDKQQIERWLPSVTTKLGIISKGDFLDRRRGDIGNREADIRLQEAGDRGSRIHAACAIGMNGGAVAIDPPWNKAKAISEQDMKKLKKKYKGNIALLQSQEEMVAVWRFREWLKLFDKNLFVVGNEVRVCSILDNYAGSLDWIFRLKKGLYQISSKMSINIINDGLFILDLKSGMESDSHKMQVAAYVEGYEKTYQEKVDGGFIFYMNPKRAGGLEETKTVFMNHSDISRHYQDFLHVSVIWERNNAGQQPKIFEYPSVITF